MMYTYVDVQSLSTVIKEMLKQRRARVFMKYRGTVYTHVERHVLYLLLIDLVRDLVVELCVSCRFLLTLSI